MTFFFWPSATIFFRCIFRRRFLLPFNLIENLVRASSHAHTCTDIPSDSLTLNRLRLRDVPGIVLGHQLYEKSLLDNCTPSISSHSRYCLVLKLTKSFWQWITLSLSCYCCFTGLSKNDLLLIYLLSARVYWIIALYRESSRYDRVDSLSQGMFQYHEWSLQNFTDTFRKLSSLISE